MLLANWSATVSNCKLDIWSAAKPIGSANLVATSVAAITVGFWVASSAAVSVPCVWRAISAAAITVGFSTLWAGIWQFMIWLLIADNRSRGITMALMRSCVSRIGGICLVSLWVSSTCFLSSWGIGLYGLCLITRSGGTAETVAVVVCFGHISKASVVLCDGPAVFVTVATHGGQIF